MTLHWWIHWFWITRTPVLLVLLLISVVASAPPYQLREEVEDVSAEWTTTSGWWQVTDSTYLPADTIVFATSSESSETELDPTVFPFSVVSVPASEDTSELNISLVENSSSAEDTNNGPSPVVSDASGIKVSVDTFISHSQGVDKPVVNVPHLITRDLKNSSLSLHNTSSSVVDVASQSLPVPHFLPMNARAGKAVNYVHQPLHPSIISTLPPSSFPQGSMLGPDKTIAENYEGRIVYTKPDVGTDAISEHEDPGASSTFEKEMGDSPHHPPESSTFPDHQHINNSTRGGQSARVTPPWLSTTKALNTTSQNGKLPNNLTMASVNLSSTTTARGKTEHDLNTTTAASVDDNTVVPTVVPISNGRVAAPVTPASHHSLDAASITGISLGILVFAALVGAVSFVLYRRRFLNKPQTLNDKCSNPDSSGYIDDSTLRGGRSGAVRDMKYKENSEEMYSLDNDSFLNSLEAMTIQNYWTDSVKHTKL